ncbi:MAG: hypothetical protein EOO16_01640 [Chitinophagaceae bacterium]|nr:MAG: hypothetical protein EOO16_01640 [Chitinophagaceae bacterium]
MRFLKPLGAFSALFLVVCCFLPWIRIESKGLEITGMDTTGTNFGKPGYLHLIFAVIFLLLIFVRRVWARRLSLFFMAFNVAWAFKNLLRIGACEAGECPEKQWALIALPVLSLLMLLAVLLAPEEIPVRKESE